MCINLQQQKSQTNVRKMAHLKSRLLKKINACLLNTKQHTLLKDEVPDHLHATPTVAAQPWKPMPQSSRRTVFVLLYWSERRFEPLQYAPQHLVTHAVTLCGLAVAVVPKSFHFAVIPLTVDCGISRRAKISQIVLLQWWLPIISPRLKFSKLFTTTHSQMFVKADCIARCWNSKTQVIWPNTFAHTVYMLLKTKDSCIL